jgi:hypothetical protein
MSPKSRRKFNKYAGQRRNPPSAAVRSQIATTTPETKVQTTTNIRSNESRASMAAAVASYANVPRELKTIGILSGILLVVLIVLAMILS